jgi:hypothetical protein
MFKFSVVQEGKEMKDFLNKLTDNTSPLLLDYYSDEELQAALDRRNKEKAIKKSRTEQATEKIKQIMGRHVSVSNVEGNAYRVTFDYITGDGLTGCAALTLNKSKFFD